MITLLDKEVVKFTRNGLEKQNLATGRSEMLTQSDYAREEKYHNPAAEKEVYQARKASGDAQRVDPVQPGPSRKKASSDSSESSHDSGHGERFSDTYEHPEGINSYRNPASSGRAAQKCTFTYGKSTKEKASERTDGVPRDPSDSPENHVKKSEAKDSGTKYYYSAKPGVGIPTHAQFRDGAGLRVGLKLGKRIGKRIKDQFKSGSDNKADDNLGLETAKSAIHAARPVRFGIRELKNIERAERMVYETTERATSRYTYGSAKRAGRAITAAAQERSATIGSQVTAKTIGRQVLKKTSAFVKNPAVMKVAVIGGAVALLMLLSVQILNSTLATVAGTTSDHPDLTTYVQQLDDNFLAKISQVKAFYESQPHTTMKIQGSDVVNTDPNELAILATGDWTYIDLTDTNKKKLTDCYNLLNTYTVTKKDEEVKSKSAPDAVSETTTTIHHITITIKTYSARDKVDDLKITDAQKKNIYDMLDLLQEIENSGGVTSGTTIPNPGTGGNPGEAFDDPQVQALVTEANQYLGFPYVWGGSTPETSFDCSGFVCWVFTHSGANNLPRTTAQGLYEKCTPVSASEAKPGDLVFFTKTYPTSDTVTHVGIYVGNNRMIHCGDPIQYTTLEKAYWQQHLYSFGRLK